jgi:hypothetical protein
MFNLHIFTDPGARVRAHAGLELVFARSTSHSYNLDFDEIFSDSTYPRGWELARQTFEFPASGQAIVKEIDLTRGNTTGSSPPELSLRVWLRIGDKLQRRNGVFASALGIAPNDELVVHALKDGVFQGVFHHSGPQAGECLVSCEDGPSSQGCVTCEVNGVFFKLCC